MNIIARNDIITRVPTVALVEDYQMLRKAILSDDKELMYTVLECLDDTIARYTEVPADCHITPDVNSLIAPDCVNGLLTNDNEEILCAGGFPVSTSAIQSACAFCPYNKHCKPVDGIVALSDDYVYEYETDGAAALLEYLKSH